MRDEQILRLEEMDSRHWWTQTRLKIVSKSVISCKLGDSKIFEIGAGSGGTLRYLKEKGFQVIALEPTMYGSSTCNSIGIETLNISFESLDFWPKNVGCILLLDVLEHIEDDLSTLRKLYNMADLGCHLVLTVPADPKLWSKLDEDVSHFRRYTLKSILSTLENSGWEIQSYRYWMSILKPVVWFRRKIIRGDFNSETRLPSNLVNKILTFLVASEAVFPFIGRIPGTTIMLVVRKI